MSFSIIESTRQNVGRKNPLTITAAPEGGRRKVSAVARALKEGVLVNYYFFQIGKKNVGIFR